MQTAALEKESSSYVCLSVCLSVGPSVTSRGSTETAKLRITQKTPHGTIAQALGLILCSIINFMLPEISAKFEQGHPVAKCRLDSLKSATID